MIRFLILAAQRTGSTVVGDALDQHSEISCEREMFLAGQKRPRSYNQFLQHSHWRRLEARLRPARSIESYLRGFFHAEPPLRAVGMKLMYNQRSAVLDRWIDVHRPRIIHLVRHNAVKVIVSRLTAERRGVYHVGSNEQAPEGAVEIPTEKLLSELEKLEAAVADQRSWLADRDALEISYEELLSDREALFTRLHEYLGVSPAGVPPLPLRKVNPDELARAVANFGELEERLRGTRFADQLD